MRAAVYQQYGGPEVLEIQEVPKPQPGNDEVLIRVNATSVTSADYRARSADFPPMMALAGRIAFGFKKPRQQILGVELAGVIEDVGKSVTRFAVGDAVFGTAYGQGFGAYAEYISLPENGFLAIKPNNLTFAEAAAIPFGAHTAMDFLRRGSVKQANQVLINGAAGCVGAFAVQLAKHFGATVTGICGAKDLDLVRSLGASEVIDYTTSTFPHIKNYFDLIFDTVGNTSFQACNEILRVDGRYILTVFSWSHLMGKLGWSLANLSPLNSHRKKMIIGEAKEYVEDLLFFQNLSESEVLKPIVDRKFSLHDIVAAHKYYESDQRSGSVVITI